MVDKTPPLPEAVREQDSERLAQQFHEAYERLAPQFGYSTREASRKPWAEVPEQNRKLMVAVCREVVEAAAQQERARLDTTILRAIALIVSARHSEQESGERLLRQAEDELSAVTSHPPPTPEDL